MNNSVLYVGVTEDIIRLIQEHKSDFYPASFTAKYNFNKLVYFENIYSTKEAIDRENKLKMFIERIKKP